MAEVPPLTLHLALEEEQRTFAHRLPLRQESPLLVEVEVPMVTVKLTEEQEDRWVLQGWLVPTALPQEAEGPRLQEAQRGLLLVKLFVQHIV